MRPPHTDAATITVRLSWAVLATCVIAWPITSLTVFRSEPQGVLGLSWVALILSAANTILTAIVNRKADSTSRRGGGRWLKARSYRRSSSSTG